MNPWLFHRILCFWPTDKSQSIFC